MNKVSPRNAISIVSLLQVFSLFIVSSTLLAMPLQATEPVYWPTTGWLTSTPEMQGMDSGPLLQLGQYITDQDLPLDSLLVIRHGYIVYEIYPGMYDSNHRHILYSVTKSFTSALVGIAMGQGYITSVDTPVVSFFTDRTIANLDARKQAMTVQHLLNMIAGLEWDEWTYPYTDSRNSYTQMMNNPDSIQFMLDLPMAADPGTTWVYNSGASHLLAGIVHEATGQLPLTFANEHLFGPLGIDGVRWDTDLQGLNFGGHDLFLRPRDMAKFGFLYLHDGVWEGQQIIPTLWVTQSKQSAVDVGYTTGYGYQWWKDQLLNTFEARGMYNQWIIVSEENDMVIVFTASDTHGEINPLLLVGDYIFPAITNQYSSPISPVTIAVISGLVVGVPIAIIGVYFYRKRKIRASD